MTEQEKRDKVIEVISNHGDNGITGSNIKRITGFHPTTLSRICTKLKNEGIIERKDKRIYITEKTEGQEQ